MSKDECQRIEFDLFEALPAELDIGAPFSLAVALTTKSGCDLTGAEYKVLQGHGAVASAGVLPSIVRFDPASNDYDPRNGPVDKRDHVRITSPCVRRANSEHSNGPSFCLSRSLGVLLSQKRP